MIHGTLPANPTVVFCTTCKGRTQHLERTLPANLRDNTYPGAKFVVVNYNSPDHLAEYIESHTSEIERDRLVVYRFTEPTPFRMAHAKNLAHRLGMREGGDILVNLDADNYTGPEFADYVAAQFRSAKDIFLWSRMIKDGPNRLPRGISGRIAVTKKAFLLSGGYDEKFHTWSPDDKDFNMRLRRMGYVAQEIDPKYLGAVLHNDKMRFREYPGLRGADSSDFELTGREGVTIANWGRFGMGVVYRNGDPEPIELGPVPTRIFGIGWHKTATTSLNAALTILGYDSAHWISAHWAKAIWTEMTEVGKSLTLERHFALCDLPIPLLYKELDRAYPNSKFILTVRDEWQWLESVRLHWDREANPYRAQWNRDPFSHQVHKLCYGQKWFDPHIFLERYRRHNREVLEYFKDRPQDLLVMDMNKGAGWWELCGFLRRRIPPVPYPRKFQTKTHYANLGDGI